jgi:prephenate dehydrogenase
MSSQKIGIIGLGLIGGSLAKSIKRVHPDYIIAAYNRNTAALEAARSEGVIDSYTSNIDNTFSDCDFIFLCTPVETNRSILSAIKLLMKPSCIISDVGSVKTNIYEAVITEGLENNFIGGHPMSGSEKTGYEHSTDHLFENAYYVLTPTTSTSPENLKALENLINSFGALTIILNYQTHDYVVAAISHLPHLVAASLVNLIKLSDSDDQIMKQVAAGGFKDITRIASSSPDMWQQIINTNSKNIVVLLDKYIHLLTEIKDGIEENRDSFIYDLFQSSRDYRNTFSDSSMGPIKKQYIVYCDVKDEAGAISNVASALSAEHISIKNIGILHNREFEEGVLQIQFYSEDAAEKAMEILKKTSYNVQKR